MDNNDAYELTFVFYEDPEYGLIPGTVTEKVPDYGDRITFKEKIQVLKRWIECIEGSK